MHLDICGENGAWAGFDGAGKQALYAAYWALVEGRCKVALIGAADSLVDLGQARDLHRMGITTPPSEAAVFFRLELKNDDSNCSLMRYSGEVEAVNRHRLKIGYCGAAQGLLHLAAGLLLQSQHTWGGFTFDSGVKRT